MPGVKGRRNPRGPNPLSSLHTPGDNRSCLAYFKTLWDEKRNPPSRSGPRGAFLATQGAAVNSGLIDNGSRRFYYL